MAEIKIKTLSGKVAVGGCTDVLDTNGILCTRFSCDNGEFWILSHKPSGSALHYKLKTQMEAQNYGRWFWSQLPKASKKAFESSDLAILRKAIPAALIKQVKIDRAKRSGDA